jgi:hypothetical protein
VLSPDEILGIYQAGSRGKCRPFCIVPAVLSLCSNSVTVAATICNPGAAGEWFSVSLTGLTPLQSGLPNAVAWPASPNPFSPSATSVYVGPNTCVTIPVTIQRPPALYGSPWFGPQKVAAYQMTIANGAGLKFACIGRLVDGAWNCPITPPPGGWWRTNLIVKGEGSVTLPFTLTNPTNALVTLHPMVRAMEALDDLHAIETNAVSLNGLPPGTPWTSAVTLPAGGSSNLLVTVSFLDTVPATPIYILLDLDIGEGGSMETIASATLLNVNPATVGPVLYLSLSEGKPLVSWDAVNTAFTMESIGDLGGTNWSPVLAPSMPLPDGSQGILLQGTNAVRFYRGKP